MTTKNIGDLKDLLKEAEKLNDAIVENTEARAKELLDEQSEAEREQEKAERQLAKARARAEAAQRARKQLFDDESKSREGEAAERDHEAAQLRFILGGGDSSEPPAPDEPDPNPASAGDDGHDHDDAGNPPTSVIPPTAPPPARNNADPRLWRGIGWLWAIIGAVLGLIVARVTYGFMWSNVHNEAHSTLVVLWFVALILAGFFTGGFIGARKEEARQNDPQPS